MQKISHLEGSTANHPYLIRDIERWRFGERRFLCNMEIDNAQAWLYKEYIRTEGKKDLCDYVIRGLRALNVPNPPQAST